MLIWGLLFYGVIARIVYLILKSAVKNGVLEAWAHMERMQQEQNGAAYPRPEAPRG